MRRSTLTEMADEATREGILEIMRKRPTGCEVCGSPWFPGLAFVEVLMRDARERPYDDDQPHVFSRSELTFIWLYEDLAAWSGRRAARRRLRRIVRRLLRTPGGLSVRVDRPPVELHPGDMSYVTFFRIVAK